MKDLTWYAVLGDITSRVMDSVEIEKTTPSSISYKKRGAKLRTIGVAPEEELHLIAYGSLIMQGYTLTLAPDNTGYLCAGGDAIYNVTPTTNPTSCTCPAQMYAGEGMPCKHIYMVRGYLAYSRKAMTLRRNAINV